MSPGERPGSHAVRTNSICLLLVAPASSRADAEQCLKKVSTGLRPTSCVRQARGGNVATSQPRQSHRGRCYVLGVKQETFANEFPVRLNVGSQYRQSIVNRLSYRQGPGFA